MTSPITNSSTEERPSVVISTQTATTTGITITTSQGSAWLIVGRDGIIITPKNLEVEVRP